MCRGEVTLITGSRCASTSMNLFFFVVFALRQGEGGGLEDWSKFIFMEFINSPRVEQKAQGCPKIFNIFLGWKNISKKFCCFSKRHYSSNEGRRFVCLF